MHSIKKHSSLSIRGENGAKINKLTTVMALCENNVQKGKTTINYISNQKTLKNSTSLSKVFYL